MSHTYSQRTKVLGIPVYGDGDVVWGDLEMTRWQMMENVILGTLSGMKNCVFYEGALTVVKKNNGDYLAMLSPLNQSLSFEGLAGGKYLRVQPEIIWDNLKPNMDWYLYIASKTGAEADHTLFVAYSKTTNGKENAALIAKITTTGSGVVDLMPPNKLTTNNLAAHIGDSKNPHGEILEQDSIVVNNELKVFGDFRLGSEKINPVSQSIQEIKLNGADGVLVTFPFPIRIAVISTKAVGAGDIWFGYNGEDAKATDDYSVMVYNSGAKDILAKIMAF